jgi:hypothetical protein
VGSSLRCEKQFLADSCVDSRTACIEIPLPEIERPPKGNVKWNRRSGARRIPDSFVRGGWRSRCRIALGRNAMTAKRLTCDDYRRMPVNEEVLDHIKSCGSCRALFEQLAEGKYKAERRN